MLAQNVVEALEFDVAAIVILEKLGIFAAFLSDDQRGIED
jgi:hypothetical protein